MQFTLSPLMGLIKTQTALPGVLGLGILILTSYLHFLSYLLILTVYLLITLV